MRIWKDDIGIINSDPYDTGWMIVVEMKDISELDNLLDAAEYRDYIGSEEAWNSNNFSTPFLYCQGLDIFDQWEFLSSEIKSSWKVWPMMRPWTLKPAELRILMLSGESLVPRPFFIIPDLPTL